MSLLAFLTDISDQLYILNMKLQDKKQNIFQLVGHGEDFCNKFLLFRALLQRNDITYFPSCSELFGEGINNDFSAVFDKTGEISD